MSDTPRTDALYKSIDGKNPSIQFGEMFAHARQLERELSARQQGEPVALPSNPTMGMWDDFCAVVPVRFDLFLAAHKAMIAGMPPAPPADPWSSIESAPRDRMILGAVDGQTRFVKWGKTSHVPIYGWCLADQGAEDFDMCKPTAWQPLPAAQRSEKA